MPPSIQLIIDRFVRAYSVPELPPVADASDPFQYVLWENVTYLVDDEHRLRAYNNLASVIGTTPAEILSASHDQFASVIALGGADKKGRVKKLIDSARTAVEKFDGDVKRVLGFPYKKAMLALRNFPSIGAPGAEKILLFCRTANEVLPLESNGLRVLDRAIFGGQELNYDAIYRRVRDTIGDDIVHETDWLIAAHLLLKKHGQIICRRVDPLCGSCILLDQCVYGQLSASGAPVN